MQLRFVGCGDAFGSGGRFNTCFHVTVRETQHLPEISPRQLVLTHMSDDMLSRIGKLPSIAAEDGMVVEF